jgi:hypothetical protein
MRHMQMTPPYTAVPSSYSKSIGVSSVYSWFNQPQQAINTILMTPEQHDEPETNHSSIVLNQSSSKPSINRCVSSKLVRNNTVSRHGK